MSGTKARPMLGMLAMAIAVAALATACGRSHSVSTDSPSGSTQDHESVLAIIQCFRSHGAPGFPDPVYDPGDGRWHFAISPASVSASTRQACQSLFPVTTPSPDLPQAQFQKLVEFATCMRQDGVPTWPDPAPDGFFRLSPDLWSVGKHGAVGRALHACAPNGGINVVPQG